jgi:hypothetical protein
METSHSLGRHCYNDICHCDWRITLYGCIESDAAKTIHILNISISGLASVIGINELIKLAQYEKKKKKKLLIFHLQVLVSFINELL